jgi:phage gp16-like protein
MTTDDLTDLDEWQRKGATLSDKTAEKEFGLTQSAIASAIRAGKLQYRRNSAHGNPFLRLLRREVETLVRNKLGDDYLKEKQVKTEIARVNRELKRLKAQIAALEERRLQLLGESRK